MTEAGAAVPPQQQHTQQPHGGWMMDGARGGTLCMEVTICTCIWARTPHQDSARAEVLCRLTSRDSRGLLTMLKYAKQRKQASTTSERV